MYPFYLCNARIWLYIIWNRKKRYTQKITGREINGTLFRSHENHLIVDTVRKLRALARLPKLSKLQREETKALMRQLREHGFTNTDIRVIVDGKWKEPTLKKDTRGVKIVSTDERDKLLELLSDFASEGGSMSDLEEYQVYKQTLNNMGVVAPQIILNFVENIFREGYQIGDLMNMKDLLVKSEMTFDDFLKHIVIMEDLNRQGIFDQELIVLNNMARAYGGINGIYTAFEKYGNIEAIKNAEILKRNNLSILQSEYSKLDAKAKALKPFLDFAETLIMQYSFNLESLDTLVKVATKYGGLSNVLEALTEYGSLQELRLEKANEIKLAELFKMQTDAGFLEQENISEKVKEMHQHLGEIKANYEQSLRLQQIQDLLTKPREVEIDSEEFLRIVSALLSGIMVYGNQNKESIVGWNRFDRRLEYARVMINNILVGP